MDNNQFSLIVERTLTDKVIEKLRDDIISKRILPQSRITIKEIAERYGVSHMPVREAFQALKGEKMIEMNPYKGATVLSVDRNFIRNAYDITGALEGLLIETAIEKGIDDKLLRKLKDINAHIEALKTPDDVEDQLLPLNIKFHHKLYCRSDNTRALEIYDYYSKIIITVRKIYKPNYERVKQVSIQHDKIIEALKDKDVEAAKKAISEHCRSARDNFFKGFYE